MASDSNLIVVLADFVLDFCYNLFESKQEFFPLLDVVDTRFLCEIIPEIQGLVWILCDFEITCM